MNGLGTLKRQLQTKALSLCTLIISDRSLPDIAGQIGISFGAVQFYLDQYLTEVQGLS